MADAMTDDGPYTLRKLRDYLNTLTDAQLDQTAQLLPPSNRKDGEVNLMPIHGVGTVEEMCHVAGEICMVTYNADDYEHHPEQVVILCDHSPFDDEGNSFFEMEEGGMRGNRTGKLYGFDHEVLEET